MKVVIAGSRSIEDFSLVAAAVAASGFHVTEVISGTARGVDQLGERWGEQRGIPVRRFPAQWQKFGRSAGMRRNEAMIRAAGQGGALIAIWDGVSRGTKHSIDFARAYGLAVHVMRI